MKVARSRVGRFLADAVERTDYIGQTVALSGSSTQCVLGDIQPRLPDRADRGK